MAPSLRQVILGCRALRTFSVGVLVVATPLAFEGIGFDTTEINAVLAAGLAGASVQMQFTVSLSRYLGRGRTLALFTASMAGATGLWAVSRSFPALLLASFVGAVSMQPNISSQAPGEQTVIAESASDGDDRSRAFAWFNAVSTLGIAAGSFAAGVQLPGGPRAQFLCVSLLLVAATGGYLSVATRPATTSEQLLMKEDLHLWQCRHRERIIGLAGLFAVDAFAGALVMNPILTHWLSLQFSASENLLGTLFGVMSVITVPSLWVAAWLGRHIGLVNTMVFTHLPSNLCLILMTLTADVRLVYLLLMLRAATGQMDVPARDSFMMTVVDKEERIACSSIITTARAVAAIVGPPISAILWETCSPGTPLVVAGILKCAYDLVLLATFRAVHGTKPAQPPT